MDNRIGLRQLRAFHAVMTTGNVTAAAQNLNLTQPAVSKQRTALEHSLGSTLFHRKSGSATSATREGIAFFKASEATISGLEDLLMIARDIATNSQRRLRIAATPPIINSHHMMQAIKNFRRDYEDIQISFEARARIDIEDWVVRRQVDFAVALLPASTPGLSARKLVDTSAVVAMAPDHVLSGEDVLTPETVQGHQVILPSRQLLRCRIEEALKASGETLQVGMEASSSLTCCHMAASGLGVAICDPYSPSTFPQSILTVRAWQPEVPLSYGALMPKDVDLSRPAARFLDLLEASFAMSHSPEHREPRHD